MKKIAEGKPRRIAFFLVVATGVFLATMDSSMINVALPFMMTSFSVSLAEIEWVVLGYLLTISATLLFWGKLSDRYGKGVIYLLGMATFSGGAMFCSISANLGTLIFSRFIQGLGASMMMSTGPAIIRLIAPSGSIGKWLGLLGISTSFGLMSGPLFGGLVLHTFSWRTLFLLNVPISFAVFLFGWLFLAGTLPKSINSKANFDKTGAALWAGSITLLIILLNYPWPERSALRFTGFFFFLAFSYLFYRYELKCKDPLLPVKLLNKRYYLIAMSSVTLSFAVLFFALILTPFYLKYVHGLASDTIGYVMMAVPVCLFVVSPLSGRLFDSMGARYLTSLGLTITGLSLFALACMDHSTSLWEIAWRLALLGCGQSIFLSPNSASVLSRVKLEDTGITAGMLATSRNLGMLIGVALVGLLFTLFYGGFSGGADFKTFEFDQLPAFLKAFRYTLSIAAAISFGSALLSLSRK